MVTGSWLCLSLFITCTGRQRMSRSGTLQVFNLGHSETSIRTVSLTRTSSCSGSTQRTSTPTRRRLITWSGRRTPTGTLNFLRRRSWTTSQYLWPARQQTLVRTCTTITMNFRFRVGLIRLKTHVHSCRLIFTLILFYIYIIACLNQKQEIQNDLSLERITAFIYLYGDIKETPKVK